MLGKRIEAAIRANVPEDQHVAFSALDREPGLDEPRFAAFVIIVEVGERA